jgi:tRNA modification GTPase
VDTIVACATPLGQSGIAVIRLSGPDSGSIILSLSSSISFKPRVMTLKNIYDGLRLIDQVLICYMPAPNSFTGEDVVEVSCHGNPTIIELIIDACITLGARPARAGEFTRRAVENGKLSFLQAESLFSLIHASSRQGIELAHSGLNGAVDNIVLEFKDKTLNLCAELEARLDYPGDELGYLSDIELINQLCSLSLEASNVADSWRAGQQKIYGAKVALIGPVNAGKSSLFNKLVNQQRALVSNIPGTTRDVVEKSILLNGLEVTFLDTAGARENAEDPIERAGIELGLNLVEEADLLLLVTSLADYQQDIIDKLKNKFKSKQCLVIGSHSDVLESDLSISIDCAVDSITGSGIEHLKKKILSKLMGSRSGEGMMLNSQRQHDIFRSLSRHLAAAAEYLEDLGPAVSAEELTFALEKLAELSGQDTREEILGCLFSKFCIGK